MQPQLIKTDLFTARQGGYWNYRIPGLLVAPGGAVLATCEARRGRGGDWDANDILLRRSLDGGVTWEEPWPLARHEDYGPGPISNCVLIADRGTGAVHALFCHDYARAFYTRSADDGETFGAPVEITPCFEAFRAEYDWNVLATGPGHSIQLTNGRLLVPVWLSSGGKSHRPSVASVIYSDDAGATWRRGEIAARTDGRLRFPSEAVAVELADGRVLLNIRSESDPHRRLIAVSPDGVAGWSEPRFDPALLDPQCMASLIRRSRAPEQDRDRVLFANPDTLERTLPGLWANAFDRKRLTVKLSYDECRTWPVS